MKTPPALNVTAFAPWYGSQAGINDAVLAQVMHDGHPAHFYDLCSGGGSLLIAKPKAGREVINDLHGGLTNLCRVLASHRWSALDAHLARTPCCEAIFDEALHAVVTGLPVAPSVFEVQTPHVQAAYYQFIVWWMGSGGEAGTTAEGRMSKRHSQGGGTAATRFVSASASVAWFHERLAGVEIWQDDLFELAPKIKDEPGTVVYCDPPFIDGGDRYAYGFHTRPEPDDPDQAAMFEESTDDYDRLAEVLGRFERATVIVRHYAHPRIDRLFPPGFWTRTEVTRNKQLSTPGQGFEGEGAPAVEWLMVKRGWAS